MGAFPPQFQCYCRNKNVTVKHNKIEYINLPCAFDTETSSFIDKQGQKSGTMYIWMFGLADHIIYGRTIEELQEFFNSLNDILGEKRLIVYVHNLSFDFQIICKYFKWDEVFATAERKILKARTGNIEFRCSYLLSGMNLANLAKELKHHQSRKMVGDLDYTKIRHSQTPLTDLEMGYCEQDIQVLLDYISEKIEDDGDITKIQLTKTGYVRQHIRNYCLYTNPMAGYYRGVMKQLTLEPEEYLLLKQAFAGGFTHASWLYSGMTLKNVRSYDFTSSYPAVMCSERFPMSKGEKIDVTTLNQKKFDEYIEDYCCLIDLTFYDLDSKGFHEHILSESKCLNIEEQVVNNGRVVRCKKCRTVVTEIDFKNMMYFYDWKNIEVHHMIIYKKGYLPKPFIECILKFYEDKTQYKGDIEHVLEYALGKELLNSSYGMLVTDIIRDEFLYLDDWTTNKINKIEDVTDKIEEYNKKKNRFIFYPWGVWVTAYARRNLFSGILAIGDDYVYSDTDSVKILNADKYTEYFEEYDRLIINKMKNVSEKLNIPFEKFQPKTKQGKSKPLGVWDDEGTYDMFKTLGAKRYLTLKQGIYKLTVSGLNEKSALPYIKNLGNNEPQKIFDLFAENLDIPGEFTGKMTHTYIDKQSPKELTDYLGTTAMIYDKTAIYLEDAPYHLSLSPDYVSFLLGVKNNIL